MIVQYPVVHVKLCKDLMEIDFHHSAILSGHVFPQRQCIILDVFEKPIA